MEETYMNTNETICFVVLENIDAPIFFVKLGKLDTVEQKANIMELEKNFIEWYYNTDIAEASFAHEFYHVSMMLHDIFDGVCAIPLNLQKLDLDDVIDRIALYIRDTFSANAAIKYRSLRDQLDDIKKAYESSDALKNAIDEDYFIAEDYFYPLSGHFEYTLKED